LQLNLAWTVIAKEPISQLSLVIFYSERGVLFSPRAEKQLKNSRKTALAMLFFHDGQINPLIAHQMSHKVLKLKLVLNIGDMP
jgi:hypothetical protein